MLKILIKNLFTDKQRKRPTIYSISSRFFFNNNTFAWFFTCYVLRVTKRDLDGKKIRGWLFNGSFTEIWVPYHNLRWTMKLISFYFDYKDRKEGKAIIGD